MILPLALTAVLAAAPPPGFVFPAPAAQASLDLARALAGLSKDHLGTHLRWLADPAREGRGLGTSGLEATARDLERRLRVCGLKPLGPSYAQTVPLREVRLTGGTLCVQAHGQKLSWSHGKGILVPEMEPGTLEAPLLLAGHGLKEDSLGRDDLKGLDVKGKAVLILGGLPDEPAWKAPALQAKHGGKAGLEAHMDRLESLGARCVLVVDPDFAGSLKQRTDDPFFRAEAGVPFDEGLPLVRLDPAAVEPLLAALRAHPKSAALHLRVDGTVRAVSSRNVLAVLPGSDPKADALVIGAHMDHLGRRGGHVHPGADDNASGVSALMEIARTLAALPVKPRHTLVFAFWTGEEEGKFGSSHYVRHPLWPLERTRAYLNLDMIGHPWSPEALRALAAEAGDPTLLSKVDPRHFAEPGHADGAPWLGESLTRAGQATGMTLHLDPGTGTSGGSDYRPFARARIPWVRFFGDFFPGYHTPQDTADRLDLGQVHRMARLVLATVWELAYGSTTSANQPRSTNRVP